VEHEAPTKVDALAEVLIAKSPQCQQRARLERPKEAGPCII
jgi:hypothetical protein